MATLRNKRKLAAVSRETPESTRSGKAPSVLDPELTQEYISQVSEEIEGRVTKKLSKEFSRTESRILGALSKLDEFLLNPQVRTCSVVAPGTSRSNNLESQGTNEDRPSDDPGPEVEFASPISGAETNPHSWRVNILFSGGCTDGNLDILTLGSFINVAPSRDSTIVFSPSILNWVYALVITWGNKLWFSPVGPLTRILTSDGIFSSWHEATPVLALF